MTTTLDWTIIFQEKRIPRQRTNKECPLHTRYMVNWPQHPSWKEQEHFDLAQELLRNPANMFEIPEMMVGYLFGPECFEHISYSF